MFLEQGVKPQNKFWKYLVGFLLIFAGATLGQMIISMVIFADSVTNTAPLPESGNESLGYLPPNITLLLLTFSFILTLVAMYFTMRYIHKQSWLSVTTSRPKTDWNRIFFAYAIAALFWIINECVLYFLHPEDVILNFKPGPFIIYFFVLILVTFFRSCVEQYVFLGYLMQGFANLTRNRWSPLLLSAALFSLYQTVHPEVRILGFWTMFTHQMLYSLFLGVITLMDDGIELPIGFHAGYLLAIQAFTTSSETSLKTDAIFIAIDSKTDTAGFDIFIPYLIILPIFLFICAKKYKWYGWKEKLTGKIQRPINNDAMAS